jgi:3-phenylpropionate/trans-cinnamate dioxygenase ferredoxin subunit
LAKYVVGSLESMPPGSQHRVEAGGRMIAVFNVDGNFYALRDICPHQGGPLSAGVVVGEVRADRPGCYEFRPGRHVRCPWHGWEYELESGQSFHDPAHSRVRAYDISVEPGADLLNGTREPGPYVAETVPITVQGEYVVVEV